MNAPETNAKCEPNLTPLLDMVLQLVMFFMLCANFVMEQLDERIKLPDAIAAKALDSHISDYVILNVDKKGAVTIRNETLDSPVLVTNRLKTVLEIDRERAERKGKLKEFIDNGEGKSMIVIRADKDCSYKQVDDVMTACRKADFHKIELRAIQAGLPEH